MVDKEHKKIVHILKYINYVFFFLQIYYPFAFVYSFFVVNSNFYIDNFGVIFFNRFSQIIVLIAQILFLIETICLQQYFSEGYRKKMRKICFLGTVCFMVVGYIFYIANIFWGWQNGRTGRKIKIYQSFFLYFWAVYYRYFHQICFLNFFYGFYTGVSFLLFHIGIFTGSDYITAFIFIWSDFLSGVFFKKI